MEQHNCHDGFSSYTNSRGPWKLVYQENYENKDDALQREKYFKSGKGREFLRKKVGAVSA